MRRTFNLPPRKDGKDLGPSLARLALEELEQIRN
jgi:hypothetical protein